MMEHLGNIVDLFQYSDEVLRFSERADKGVINDFSCDAFFSDLGKLERTRLRNATTRSNIIGVSVSKEDIGPSFRTTFFEFDNEIYHENEEWPIKNYRDDIVLKLSSRKIAEVLSPNTIQTENVRNVSPLTTTIPDPKQDDSYRDHLTNDVTPILLNRIRHEDFEFGESSPSIELVETHFDNRKYVTLDWLNEVYTQYYGKDENVLIGLLRIVEFIGKDLFPLGRTMAIAAIAHKNDEIKELGLRILEADCSVDTLSTLKKLDITTPWLLAYVKQIISDFEQELSYGDANQENYTI